MAYNFIECNREQMSLMPPSLREWLPEEDLSWFVIDAVGQIELSGFYKKYRPDGKDQAAFEPSMMVPLMFYAYCNGIRSSRMMEGLCERDIAYKIVTANTVPDHSTICRFRQENEKELERLFIDTLKLCAGAGIIKVGAVSLDGTKMKANATDPDSRIMKTRTGYVQGYNAQAVVTEDQIIIAAELTKEENDVKQLHRLL